MPGTTATQRLTYPTSGDRLADQAAYIETLARQVDSRINAQVNVLAQQADRPLAIVDSKATRNIQTSVNAVPKTNGLITWDTVLADTAGLVDLSVDTHIISMTSPGYWLVGCYIDFVGNPGGSSCASVGSITLHLNSQNCTPSQTNVYGKDVGGVIYTSLHASALVHVGSTGSLYMNADTQGTSCPTTVNVFNARMWAFKAREL